MWQVLNRAATRLPREFEEANFDFFHGTLTGVRQMSPRNERVIEAIGGRVGSEPLGQALGELFVGEGFPPEAKRRALELVGHVKAALRERLEKLDWMEAETRKSALEKLDRMAVKIGYPDRWRDLSAAQVGEHPYVQNWLAANDFEFGRNLARLGKPVDRGEWWMSPHVVNAYFSSTLNEIVFPAGILQPPYFDPKADDADGRADLFYARPVGMTSLTAAPDLTQIRWFGRLSSGSLFNPYTVWANDAGDEGDIFP